MKCIFCNEETTNLDFMLGIEVPYMNFYVHRECYKRNESNLKEFLEENLAKYLETSNNRKK